MRGCWSRDLYISPLTNLFIVQKLFVNMQKFHQPTLMHNFLYSLTIRLLHYYPLHVSSINMPIFRRKNCIHTASGIFALCKRLHSTLVESGLFFSFLYYVRLVGWVDYLFHFFLLPWCEKYFVFFNSFISSTNFNAQFSLFINNMFVTLLSSTYFEL